MAAVAAAVVIGVMESVVIMVMDVTPSKEPGELQGLVWQVRVLRLRQARDRDRCRCRAVLSDRRHCPDGAVSGVAAAQKGCRGRRSEDSDRGRLELRRRYIVGHDAQIPSV